MAALLVMMAVMAIAMTTALPVWHTVTQRDKEEELIFRGNQYAHAIAMFQRKYGGAFPPTVDVLVREKFLRRKYKDPITGDDFQVVGPGDAAAAALSLAAGAARPGLPGAGGRGATSSPQDPMRALVQQSGRQARQGGIGGRQSAFGALQRGQPGGIGPTAGVMGVRSKSTDKAFRVYNGRDHYNEWIFVGTQAAQQAGAPAGRGRGVPAPGGAPAQGLPFGAPGRGFGPPQGGRRFGGP
jgi:type II secretory pathway pseudopilin PulG